MGSCQNWRPASTSEISGGVVERALADAKTSWTDLESIAVTQGPGLIGSLLIGVAFGKALSAALEVPLVPVHHLAGHIESLVLEHGEIPLPAMVLVVSGGHTNLYLVRAKGKYLLVGRIVTTRLARGSIKSLR